MIKIKTPEELLKYPVGHCAIAKCNLDGEKLFSTETTVLDVCLYHYAKLENERQI